VKWRINTQTDKNVQIQLRMSVVHNKGVNPKVRSCLVWLNYIHYSWHSKMIFKNSLLNIISYKTIWVLKFLKLS